MGHRTHAVATRTKRIEPSKQIIKQIKTPGRGRRIFFRKGLLSWDVLSALSGLLVRLLVLLIRLLLTASALLTATLAALLVLTTLILIILGH